MRLLLDMLKATYWFDDALQTNLERQGFIRLTRAQSFLIANVALGEHRAGTIARNLGISRQAVSFMLADLERRGLVCFKPDPSDGRARVVVFSKSFQPQGLAAQRLLGDLEAELSKRIGKDHMTAMRDALATDWGVPPIVATSVKPRRAAVAANKRPAPVGRKAGARS